MITNGKGYYHIRIELTNIDSQNRLGRQFKKTNADGVESMTKGYSAEPCVKMFYRYYISSGKTR